MIRKISKIIKQSALSCIRGGDQQDTEQARLANREQEKRKFYSQFISPGELCFDVGANVGNRVKTFLDLGAEVVAIEPQELCVRALKESFGNDPRFRLVEAALGAAEGEAEMLISNASTISSLSPEWVQSVKASGRFANYNWERKQTISITTLDRLFLDYGQPAFIKIDVEGFEYQVVSGLSRPVRCLSFEFTPEFLDGTRKVISHLNRLGAPRYNYSLGESMRLELQDWVIHQAMEKSLSKFENDATTFGDVYVRFPV